MAWENSLHIHVSPGPETEVCIALLSQTTQEISQQGQIKPGQILQLVIRLLDLTQLNML